MDILQVYPLALFYNEWGLFFPITLLGKRVPEIATVIRLKPIDGQPPNMARLPAGCSFAARCPRALDRCHVEAPPPIAAGAGREARCWLAEEDGA